MEQLKPKRTGNYQTKHRACHTRIYSIWASIKTRCTNPNHIQYHRYGGRGIKMCQDWETDFRSFQQWALSHGYDDNLTIDRIDNDGGYYPCNCRWATRKEQTKSRDSAIGERAGRAVLTDEIVLEMRQAKKEGLNYMDISRKFGTNYDTTRAAVLGISWGHLPHP